MKSTITIVGIIFIVLGISSFAYQGFTYTQQEKIAQIGDVKVTADTEKTIYLSPIAGALSIIAGVALVFAGRK